MRNRHPNHRHVKKRRTYTVEEISRLFNLHRNTVRRWIKDGLRTTDEKRPMLVLGDELVVYLLKRRKSRQRHCSSGELYCVRCHAPKLPAGGMVDYRPVNDKIGKLTAICPDCNSIMNRFVSAAKFSEMRLDRDTSYTQALTHLRETAQPAVNSDLR